MSDEGPVIYGGRYELHRRLARGGMADVYLARDRLLDRPVAVKVLFSQYAADPAFVERFRREAQSAANLNHPNIVSVFDWGEEDGTYYIVMEYVAGRSLADVLAAEGTLLPERAADIGIDVAAALGFAHRNGVVHRDVKPGNVLLASDGQVKVADFGIARAISATDDDLTQAGLVMGTATYFSPEQAQGKQVDPRSDLYSLGIVLYEAVCGRPPFRGDDALAVAYQHVQEQPVPPREINPDLEVTLAAIITKSLAKQPGNRYPSAEDLRADLRRYREGHRIEAGATAATAVSPPPPPAPPVDSTQAMPVTRAQTAAATGYYDEYRTGEAAVDYDAYEEPPRRNGVFIGVLLLLLGVVGILLFLLASALGIFDDDAPVDTGGEPLPVANVIGETVEEARRILTEQGFEVEATPELNPDVEPGIVFEQDPAADTELEPGATVTLTFSESELEAEIPDVRGRTPSEAISALNAAGFTNTRVEEVSDSGQPANTVIDTTPPAGEVTSVSTEIVLQVTPEDRIVQDVAGRTVSEAEAILRNQGFTVTVAEEASDTVPEGVVIRTSPGAGTRQPFGSAVTLVVSAGVEQVTVPSVVEKTEETARADLGTAGFGVVVEYEELLPGDPNNGRVLRQDPAGGSQAPKGSTVTIVVGKAPLEETTTTTTTTSAAPTTQPDLGD